MEKQQIILDLLEKNYGKIFSCKFIKRTDNTLRHMVCRQGVKQGGTTPLKGGEWCPKGSTKAIDHGLILVTDIDLEKAEKYSRRSIPIDSILEIKAGGRILKFEK